MDLGTTLLLGFIAGVTIVIGIPVGRLSSAAPRVRVLLASSAVGVLLFLLWDVLSAAWEPIDEALAAAHEGESTLGQASGYGLLFAGGIVVGLLSLVAYDRWMATAGRRARHAGPGAMVATELRGSRIAAWSPARRTTLMIAVGIGLHNFAEGLAIGQAAASGAIALATLLVIGFALHNATEGFGIVAPLVADADESGNAQKPSWAFLLAMAAIGGGPTFIGTAIGHQFTSEAVSVAFLALAAGSITYVVAQLLGITARAKRPDLVAYGLLIGLLAGFATDAIITAAGV